MPSKKHLDNTTDIPDDSENEAEVKEESCVKFPQYEGAKGALRRQQEIISEITGEPTKGLFLRKKEIVGSTRKKVEKLPKHQADQQTTKKKPRWQKPDRPTRKL